MGIYTVRFAHLDSLPEYSIGDLISSGMVVGKMGKTGQSKGAHLHIDLVSGYVNSLIHLSEIGYETKHSYRPNIQQLNYFIDNELFKSGYKISTYFYDPRYKVRFGKDHPAYDIYPTSGNWNIYWNRSKAGYVLAKGHAPESYGNWISIGIEF